MTTIERTDICSPESVENSRRIKELSKKAGIEVELKDSDIGFIDDESMGIISGSMQVLATQGEYFRKMCTPLAHAQLCLDILRALKVDVDCVFGLSQPRVRAEWGHGPGVLCEAYYYGESILIALQAATIAALEREVGG